MKLFFSETLDDLSHSLLGVLGSHKRRIFGLHDDQILNIDRRNGVIRFANDNAST